MVRVEESRRHFHNWALWKKAGGPATECLAVESIDQAISRWPEELRSTVAEVYLTGGDMRAHALRLGCPETTVARRLGRADRLLIDQLHAFDDRSRVEAERARLRERLARQTGPGTP